MPLTKLSEVMEKGRDGFYSVKRVIIDPNTRGMQILFLGAQVDRSIGMLAWTDTAQSHKYKVTNWNKFSELLSIVGDLEMFGPIPEEFFYETDRDVEQVNKALGRLDQMAPPT